MLDLSESDDEPAEQADEDIDYNREEGEFVPPEDWACHLEGGPYEDVDLDANIDEHIVSPSKTELVIQTEEGEKVVDVDEEIDDTSDDDEEASRRWKESLKMRPLEKQTKKQISHVDITEKRAPNRGIIGWHFDKDLQLFAIKRYDGVQYLERKLAVFSSLPRFEVRDLARLPLNNPSNDPYGNYVEKIIRTEGRSMKFERIKPRVGKTIKLQEKSSRTGRRRRMKVYPAIKCVTQIPLKTMPQDILENLKNWHVDSTTGEAVMIGEDDEVEGGERELLRVYDHRHLMNLSEKDLLKLHQNRILATESWGDLARYYQLMVKTCVKMKIYAGSTLYDQ